MQRIHAIRNARIRGRARLCDIELSADGVISEITDAGRAIAGNAEIDAQGMLVLPSPIDSHLHLDLAYSMERVAPNVSGTLGEAILHWSEAKRNLRPDEVCHRALRGIRDEVGFGTGHIRTHVDVSTAAGLRLCEGVLLAREQARAWVDIQVVAFPQDGILKDRGAEGLIREALAMGCDLIGGIAHNERTDEASRRHIETLFDLAEEFDRDIDWHIDETDDARSRCVEVLAARALEREWQDRVTASHVCALASYDDSHAAKVIDLLAEARVHVVTNPGVNLHLQGRHDDYPKRRGLTRVRQLLAAGVNVSAGQDCIKDPFYPMGTGNLFDVGHLLIHADHLSTAAQIDQVADVITTNAARTLGLDRYGLIPGKSGDLVVLSVESVHDAFRTHLPPVAVVKNGMCVARQGEVEAP